MAPNGSKVAGPKQRAEILLRTRNLKMARNAHAYVRGSTAKFYEWLEAGRSKLPAGPSVWICGDCHLGNLGPLADAKGHVEVQIRDLDQKLFCAHGRMEKSRGAYFSRTNSGVPRQNAKSGYRSR
jgi:uncharacterized protein (DUF2252 family)